MQLHDELSLVLLAVTVTSNALAAPAPSEFDFFRSGDSHHLIQTQPARYGKNQAVFLSAQQNLGLLGQPVLLLQYDKPTADVNLEQSLDSRAAKDRLFAADPIRLSSRDPTYRADQGLCKTGRCTETRRSQADLPRDTGEDDVNARMVFDSRDVGTLSTMKTEGSVWGKKDISWARKRFSQPREFWLVAKGRIESVPDDEDKARLLGRKPREFGKHLGYSFLSGSFAAFMSQAGQKLWAGVHGKDVEKKRGLIEDDGTDDDIMWPRRSSGIFDALAKKIMEKIITAGGAGTMYQPLRHSLRKKFGKPEHGH